MKSEEIVAEDLEGQRLADVRLQIWESAAAEAMQYAIPVLLAKREYVKNHEVVETVVEIADGIQSAWEQRRVKFNQGRTL